MTHENYLRESVKLPEGAWKKTVCMSVVWQKWEIQAGERRLFRAHASPWSDWCGLSHKRVNLLDFKLTFSSIAHYDNKKEADASGSKWQLGCHRSW